MMYMFYILITNKRWLQEKSFKHATVRGGTRVLPMNRGLPRRQKDKQPLRTINKDSRLMKPPIIKEQQFIGKPLIALTSTPHN